MKPIVAAGLIALGVVLGAAGLAAGQALIAPPKGDPQPHVLGSLDLGPEFPAMKGYVLTLGMTTIAPGAGKTAHTHHSQPEVQYIASGVLTDQRNGGPPIAHGPGSVLLNTTGTTHATVNSGAAPVTFYVAAIAAADAK